MRDNLSDRDRASFQFLSRDMACQIDALHGRGTTPVSHAHSKMKWLHIFYSASANSAAFHSMTYGTMSSLQDSWQRFFGVADTPRPVQSNAAQPDSIVTLRYEQQFQCTHEGCTNSGGPAPLVAPRAHCHTLLQDHASGGKLEPHHSIDERISQEVLWKVHNKRKSQCQACRQDMALTAVRVTQAPKLLHYTIKGAYDNSVAKGNYINGDTITVVGHETYDLAAVMYGDDSHFKSLIKHRDHGKANRTLWRYDGMQNGGVFQIYLPSSHSKPPRAEQYTFPLNLDSYYANALIYVRRDEVVHPQERAANLPINDATTTN